ncbi:histone-like nucleoid-structuring protein Lsr2 [Mycolicibacterium neoaurum]|uniref:histone-like nucleoid-structuring protein Lsr2 n=1 Tax=Mycolicibacterium neoaurum TaxID=1795 RepID=UPI001F4CFB34|nr:Lsr2 family protein [Mycolicibacterium neoaurum]
MAERVVRQLIDDIDGSEIIDGEGERIDFSLRGVDYRIDLSNANIAKLDKALKPYVDAAAKVRTGGARRVRSTGVKTASSKEQLFAIREWARKNGYEVSDRGRVKAEVIQAFESAH